MTREELFEAIGEIDEKLVEETRIARGEADRKQAEQPVQIRRRRPGTAAVVGVILAACVAAAIAIPAVRSAIRGNGSSGSGAVTEVNKDEITAGGAGAAGQGDSYNGPQAEIADFGPDEADAGGEEAAADTAARSEMEEAAAEDARSWSDSAVGIERLLQLNGCYYEVIDRPSALMRCGLPARITADMAGEHVAWLVPDGAGFAETTQTDTDPELFEYAPEPSRAVYVLFDGYEWNAAVFCNFILLDSNASVELTELYRMYGIEGAGDIVSVSAVGRNRDEVIGTPVTDRAELDAFYEITAGLTCFGNDDFQALVFDGTPEEEQPALHSAFANDMRTVRIETAAGPGFYLEVHPSYGWMFGPGTQSWYQIGDGFAGWLGRNLSIG